MRFRAISAVMLALACSSPTEPRAAETDVIFLGDSFVQSFQELVPWFGPAATSWINDGHGGLECAQLRSRIPAEVDTAVSHTAVVLIGINDVILSQERQTDAAYLSTCLAAVASDLQARGVRVVMSTLLPVSSALATSRPVSADYVNGMIRQVNANLRVRARAGAFTLADSYLSFIGPDSAGIGTMYNADGLHPNKAALQPLADRLAAALRQIGALPE
jgi:lysophospholipase L1-like esterase